MKLSKELEERNQAINVELHKALDVWYTARIEIMYQAVADTDKKE